MATLVDQEYVARLQVLGDKFAARVPETLRAIETVLARCNAESTAPEDFSELHHLLHGIAGSAGTFGFTMLGRQARELEQQLRGVMAGQGAWPPLAIEVARYLRWAVRDPRAELFNEKD